MKPTFSAALLAGGKSSRMGSDKARLLLPGATEPLWRRQLRTLEALRPAEIFWSGPPRPGLPEHLKLVRDEIPDAGPLAGLTACLARVRTDLLVVLAIDLPDLPAAFLRTLLALCTAERGAVIQRENFFEPLAAVYPKALHPLAANHLHAGRRALQDLVHAGLIQNLLAAFPVTPAETPYFENFNTPRDGFAPIDSHRS